MASGATAPHQRFALVTGGAGGIGQAICRRLAQDGCRVALADVDAAAAERCIAELGPDHVFLPADLTDQQAAASLPERAAHALGGLDLVVNNAGITDSTGETLVDMPQGTFDRLVALNITAVERICTSAADILATGSCIVNVASGAAFRPLALRGPYSATKAAIVALTEALARDYAPRNLRVCAVAPGYTRTPLLQTLHKEGRVDLDSLATGIPLGRLATPEDIARAVAFLATPEGAPLSGRTLVIDGGGSAGIAPDTAPPEPGTKETGVLALLGPMEISGPCTKITLREGLFEHNALSAVIDSASLSDELSTQEMLDRARQTARICAAHKGRSRHFALLFVSPSGTNPAVRAAGAAQGMFARTLALEWARVGIRVNALTWHGRSQAGLGAVCRFLVGSDAAFITGQHLNAGDLGYP